MTRRKPNLEIPCVPCDRSWLQASSPTLHTTQATYTLATQTLPIDDDKINSQEQTFKKLKESLSASEVTRSKLTNELLMVTEHLRNSEVLLNATRRPVTPTTTPTSTQKPASHTNRCDYEVLVCTLMLVLVISALLGRDYGYPPYACSWFFGEMVWAGVVLMAERAVWVMGRRGVEVEDGTGEGVEVKVEGETDK